MSSPLKGGIVGACLASLLIVLLFSPGASGGNRPTLKVTTVRQGAAVPAGTGFNRVEATCPKGYRVTGGGGGSEFGRISEFGPTGSRKYGVTIEDPSAEGPGFAEAICVKGTNGLKVAGG